MRASITVLREITRERERGEEDNSVKMETVKNGLISNTEDPQIHFKEFPSTYIDDIAKNEGYIEYGVLKTAINTAGGNYTADLYEVKIKGKTISGDKETNIFVKIMKPGIDNSVFSITDSYLKEYFAYNELSKVFTQIQNDAKIPELEKFKMPKHYQATNTKAVFLENLKQQGFTTLYRMDVMTIEYGELSVKQLAKFHALSYVLQSKRPQYFDTYLKTRKPNFNMNDEWKKFMMNLVQITINGLSYESKKKVDHFVTRIFGRYITYMTDTSSPGCTICHGDYIPPNILMKIRRGQIIEVIPVDYQMFYYGSPINDFIMFMFYASDREFRKKHLIELKNLYYDHLNIFLGYFNIDVSKVFPRSEFERQFSERLDLGLFFALYSTPFQFTKKNHVPDIMQDDLTKLEFVLDNQYCPRIQGVVDDFIDWGYL